MTMVIDTAVLDKQVVKEAVRYARLAIGRRFKAYAVSGATMGRETFYITIAIKYDDLGDRFRVDRKDELQP